MKLTKTERALIANQNRILALLDESNSDSYLLKAKIAEHGYEGMYHKIFDEIYDGISEETCEETQKILTMYRVINNFIATLSSEVQKELDLNKIKFDGFDMNNDDHYFYMTFLVEEANLYEEHKEAYLNSHSMSSLIRYRRMLPVYNQKIESNNYQLDLEGLKSIISAV